MDIIIARRHYSTKLVLIFGLKIEIKYNLHSFFTWPMYSFKANPEKMSGIEKNTNSK